MATCTATEGTWSYWVTSSSATSTTTCSTWDSWNGETSTSTATGGTFDTIWYTWTTNCSTARPAYPAARPVERSDDSFSKRQKRAQEAEEKAKELLLDLIGQEDLEVYNKTGRLFVKGRKYDYIVQKSGFIQRVEKDKITDLCVHLDNRYKYPSTDNVIAMKLAIEADEDLILKLANDHGSNKRPKKLPLAACM